LGLADFCFDSNWDQFVSRSPRISVESGIS